MSVKGEKYTSMAAKKSRPEEGQAEAEVHVAIAPKTKDDSDKLGKTFPLEGSD